MITNLTIPVVCFLFLLHSPSLLLYHQPLVLHLPQPLNSILLPRPLKALFLHFLHPLFFPLKTPISASSNPFISLLIPPAPPVPPVLHRMNPLHHQLHVPSCDLYKHSSLWSPLNTSCSYTNTYKGVWLPVVVVAVVLLNFFFGEAFVTDIARIGRWQSLGSLASNKFRHSGWFIKILLWFLVLL